MSDKEIINNLCLINSKLELINKNDINIFNNAYINDNIKELFNKINLLNKNVLNVSENNDNLKVKIPLVDNIKKINPLFNYYKGDDNLTKGLYVSICKGMYVKMCFPEIIDSKKNKEKTIKCKFYNNINCNKNNSNKNCNFTHKNEKFKKINNIYKCRLESLGNLMSLDHDLNVLQIDDIKKLLLYSLSDLYIVHLWFQNKYHDSSELILHNIDTC
jgi:hypothetical protein